MSTQGGASGATSLLWKNFKAQGPGDRETVLGEVARLLTPRRQLDSTVKPTPGDYEMEVGDVCTRMAVQVSRMRSSM